MRKVAIVTGATGGLGKEFTRLLDSSEDIDEIWAVGRNPDKLNSLCETFGKVVPICADLSDGIEPVKEKIETEDPDIRLLINNAGVGFLVRFEDMDTDKVMSFCDVNCTAPAALISASLGHMREGAGIINISSASSYQPNPYLAQYSASKVFIRNFSRALNMELKPRSITVTAACPGWIDTDMLPKEKDGKKIRYTGIISARKVAEKALKDNRKGKDMSTPGWFSKYFRIYSKITPTGLVMRQWTGIVGKQI